jgi:hypothetical protein
MVKKGKPITKASGTGSDHRHISVDRRAPSVLDHVRANRESPKRNEKTERKPDEKKGK